MIVSLLLCLMLHETPPDAPEGPQAVESKADRLTRLGPGVWVEAEGHFRDDGRFEILEIEVKEASSRSQLLGPIESVTDTTIRVCTFDVTITEETKLETPEGDSVTRDRLQVGQWVKVKGKLRGLRQMVGRTIELETPRERWELEGTIESANESGTELVLLGVAATRKADVKIDVDEELLTGTTFRSATDEEEFRPLSFRPTPWLSLGGKLELRFEQRDRYELDSNTNRDNARLAGEAEIAALVQPNAWLTGFVEAQVRHEAVLFDQERDLDRGENTQVKELWLNARDLPGNTSVTVGRQRLKDYREWLYDERLDAVRVWGGQDLRWEAWVGTLLVDPEDEEDRWTFSASLSYPLSDDAEVTAYVLDRQDGFRDGAGRERRESPLLVGLRSNGELVADLDYWLELAHTNGVFGQDRLNGFAFDLGGTYVFDAPFEPSLTIGWAYASGDDHPGGVDRTFRQSGLHDNNGKFNGVTSFRYYGELLDPELANLNLLTVGAGLRPLERTSLDLVYHLYRQSVRATEVRDFTDLREQATGNSRDLGQGFDAVLGIREFGNLDIEVVAAWFLPGRAFQHGADSAFLITALLRLKF